jgi:hypothetical protein
LTQGLTLARQALYHLSQSTCPLVFSRTPEHTPPDYNSVIVNLSSSLCPLYLYEVTFFRLLLVWYLPICAWLISLHMSPDSPMLLQMAGFYFFCNWIVFYCVCVCVYIYIYIYVYHFKIHLKWTCRLGKYFGYGE